MATISALQRTELFARLTEIDLADIEQEVKKLQFKKGEAMFLAGDPGRGIFIIVRGQVRVFQHNTEGREQVMHVDSEGAVIGTVPVFDGGPYPASATCKTDVEALFIERDAMHRFCAKYPLLALTALQQMAGLVRSHAQLVEALSLHEVGQRLALLLLTEGQRGRSGANGRITFQLSLSNQEVANRIGSVRDVVSRAFAHLQRDRLIARKGRSVTICDRKALQLFAKKATKPGTSSPHAGLKSTA